MTLSVVNLFQVRIVSDGLDSFLQWNNFVITGHDYNRAEFETFGEMHGADRDLAAGGLDRAIKDFKGKVCSRDGGTRTIQFGLRTDKNSKLVR